MSKKKETKEERSERRRKELRLALRVFRYFLPYKWAMVVALLASAVVSGTTAGTAWLIKPALDDIFIRQDGTALLYVPLAFIVLTALKGAGRYLQNWCMHYSALHVLETMRQELFQKIITLPLHFYEESQVGALMSRVINDVGMIRQSLPAFIQIIRQVITMISLLYVVFQQNFELACWAIIVLPVAGFPLSLFSRALRRYGRKNAEVNASISSMLQELLSGIRVIKAFATEKQETGRFNKENARIININFRQSCVSELSSPVMELIGAIGIGLVWRPRGHPRRHDAGHVLRLHGRACHAVYALQESERREHERAERPCRGRARVRHPRRSCPQDRTRRHAAAGRAFPRADLP